MPRLTRLSELTVGIPGRATLPGEGRVQRRGPQLSSCHQRAHCRVWRWANTRTPRMRFLAACAAVPQPSHTKTDKKTHTKTLSAKRLPKTCSCIARPCSCIAYALDKESPDEVRNYLVFDMGARSLDLTRVEIEDGALQGLLQTPSFFIFRTRNPSERSVVSHCGPHGETTMPGV